MGRYKERPGKYLYLDTKTGKRFSCITAIDLTDPDNTHLQLVNEVRGGFQGGYTKGQRVVSPEEDIALNGPKV